jgi:excisionase family DNA binding protein
MRNGDGPVLLTVREVATALRVCTATVYGILERGELEHVRVSNAIRVVVTRDETPADPRPD